MIYIYKKKTTKKPTWASFPRSLTKASSEQTDDPPLPEQKIGTLVHRRRLRPRGGALSDPGALASLHFRARGLGRRGWRRREGREDLVVEHDRAHLEHGDPERAK